MNINLPMTLPELFRHYLKTQKASSATIKNYVADVNNFLDWLTQRTGVKHQVAGSALFGLFTNETLEEYKVNLLKSTPLSTLNRRLSALRKFGFFAQNRGWIKNNPALRVKNASTQAKTHFGKTCPNRKTIFKVLKNFQKHLREEKMSSVTTKNYLSDLRHFFAWLETT